MTVESCVSYCNGLGYSYAGIEYGECGDVSIVQNTTDSPFSPRMLLRIELQQRCLAQQHRVELQHALRG
jgi:hypothetical protein